MTRCVFLYNYIRRLLGDHGEGKCSADTKKYQVKEEEIVVRLVISSDVDILMNEQLGESKEACLVNMSFHIFELIAEHCVAVEYLNFSFNLINHLGRLK